MKNFLKIKYLILLFGEYIFIFLTATIFLFVAVDKSFSDENIFTVDNVKIEGTVDINFSREKYINKAFVNSFDILMTKILLSKDFDKTKNIKLDQIKKLISSFQILEESYKKNLYMLNIKIIYNDNKVKNYLAKRNISFSQPENISTIFYPVFFIEDEIQNFNENFFYKNWEKVVIKNQTLNFILPLEDLEDISKIMEMKNRIEDLDINFLINKYDVKNYVFALIDYQKGKLNVHIKSNFKNSKISKNISYELKSMKNAEVLKYIIKDLKLKISDLWKEKNLINLLMPLSIKLKFEHKKLKNLDKLRKTFLKIDIIDNYVLEEFNINTSLFKIYYYGDPKKLESKLSKFGYRLVNVQGHWELYLNE